MRNQIILKEGRPRNWMAFPRDGRKQGTDRKI